MTIPEGLCSKCHEDFYHCRCTQFYPNLPDLQVISTPIWFFELKEVQALYRILEHQFIDVEDNEARAVVDRIAKILKENS